MTKKILLLVTFTLASPGLLAVAPHPSVLTVKYKDQLLPVVRVSGSDPYVMVDGEEKLIRSEPRYLIQDGEGYSDNFVTAPRGALGGKLHFEAIGENTYDPSSLHSGTIDFQVSLTAQKTIKGGFWAIVLYSPDGPAEVIVHELPELPAGRLVKTKLSVHALPRVLEPHYFVQIFDDTGREVLTNDTRYAWQYYADRDRARIAVAVKKYLEKNRGADHDAVPAFTPKPIFRPGTVLPKGEIIVKLSVDPEGLVTFVDGGMVEDDNVRHSLIDAMGGWLFLPKLKAGQPVDCRISVPLQF